jgi:hypothetical protein
MIEAATGVRVLDSSGHSSEVSAVSARARYETFDG